MHHHKSLTSLFDLEPHQWGLRGDPYLWRDLRERLGSSAYPTSEAAFTALLLQTITELVGEPLGAQRAIFVARYSHGGMSSGQVSPQFWHETGLPLLQARYRAQT